MTSETLSKPKWMRDEKLFSNDDVVRNIQEDSIKFSEEYTIQTN